MTSQKKPGVAFWATVGLVVLLVGYPLSFGPAVWLALDSHPNFSMQHGAVGCAHEPG